MNFFYFFLNLLVQAMTFAILARVILSWLPLGQGNFLSVIVFQITEPLLAPIRRIIPRLGFFDLSPVIAILLLQAIYAASTWALSHA